MLVIVVMLSVGGYAVARSGSRGGARLTMAGLLCVATAAPPAGPRVSTAAEQRYIDRARRQTIARDPGCKAPVNSQRGATLVHRAPPRALLAALGVLRRRALPADRSTRMLMRNGFDAGAGVYVNYIRRARTAFGKSYYLVPEARIGVFGPIPNRCYGEMRTALKHDLRSARPALRKSTLSVQAQEFAAERLEARQQQGLCFAAVSLGSHARLGGVDEGCTAGVPNVRTPLAGGIGEGDRAGGTIFAAVVPDVVASVTLEFDAAAAIQHGRSLPAQSTTSSCSRSHRTLPTRNFRHT